MMISITLWPLFEFTRRVKALLGRWRAIWVRLGGLQSSTMASHCLGFSPTYPHPTGTPSTQFNYGF
ncbi:MAG: hypothetical protein IIC11_06750 [Proteobacteria bacterium]|nr:hypothetical protein [Pseudomonadota bacterium]